MLHRARRALVECARIVVIREIRVDYDADDAAGAIAYVLVTIPVDLVRYRRIRGNCQQLAEILLATRPVPALGVSGTLLVTRTNFASVRITSVRITTARITTARITTARITTARITSVIRPGGVGNRTGCAKTRKK